MLAMTYMYILQHTNSKIFQCWVKGFFRHNRGKRTKVNDGNESVDSFICTQKGIKQRSLW